MIACTICEDTGFTAEPVVPGVFRGELLPCPNGCPETSPYDQPAPAAQHEVAV